MIVLVLILLVLVGGAVTLLAVQNLATTVHLELFSWQSPEIPLGLLILAAFLLGALALYVVSILAALKERRELKALRTHVAQLEEQYSLLQGNVPPVAAKTMHPLPKGGSGPLSPSNGSFLPMPGLPGQSQQTANGGSSTPTQKFH